MRTSTAPTTPSRGDDAALYRDWLHSGFPAGRMPNEVRAIFGLLGGKPYPAAFDWQRYCRAFKIEAAAPYPAKIAALEALFEQPLDARARDCIGGHAAGGLYEALGNYHLIRARYREAADGFRTAIEANARISRRHLRLGDALRGLGEPLAALASYRRALALPESSIWALIHAGTIMLSQKMFREALELVEAQRDAFLENELYDGFVDEVAATAFRAVSETMHAMISDDRQDAVLDTYADGRLGEVTAFLARTKIGADSVRLPATRPRRFVMLACLDLAQCTFYRVEQKRRLLEARGIELEVFDFNDPVPFMSALPGAAAAIFYRAPCYPKIVEAMLYARSLGIATYFDIDDLVFTRDFPDSFESYENLITRQDYFGLCHGVALYRQAISLCDGAIVSTRPLAETIAPLVREGAARTFVVPNGLDDRSDAAARFALSKGTPGDDLSIFYGSGTKAHSRDFTDIVAPALLEALAREAQLRLVIAGHVPLDARFNAFAARIARFDFIEDLDTYWSILASCDINIAVLRAGPIADGKSEIKWLEAAMLAIPSIVSATATYEDVLRDGETVLLARGSDDWGRHLRALIEDAGLRRRIGTNARELALRAYGPDAVTAKLEAALAERKPMPPQARAQSASPRKPRLLVCNVFFAPQSTGGATRVVEDNVEQLVARYGDAFEVSILSTFKGLKVGALRVDTHRGRPLYRIGTPLEVNMFWRPFNDDVLPAFRRVLEVAQPDLVHFHCVQRLTASLLEETLRAGIPYVVTLHDAWWISDHQFLVDQDDRLAPVDSPFQTLLPAGVTRAQSLRRLQRLKSLLASSAAALAVSASFADLYRRAGIVDVRVCENGLSTLEPPLAKTTPPGRIVLGHIGGRSVHKGAGLIEAVLKLHDFRNLDLLMIDGTLEVGEEQIELWGTTPVTLRAPVGRGDVDQLYAAIDVLLAPSIWPESYGLVAREAMHFRTWVVASDRGALAQDVIEDENGFVVDPSSTYALAAVLARIDADVARFKLPPCETALRQSSRQLDEIVDIYREVLRDATLRAAETVPRTALSLSDPPRKRAG